MEIEREEIEREKITVEELLRKYVAGERNLTRLYIFEPGDSLLRGVDLSGINLENSYLSADFSGAILRKVNFRYTIWDIPTWEDIDFTGSDFTGINNVVGCAFIDCNFSNTVWNQADLWQSQFVDCEVDSAEFGETKFCEVRFMTKREFFGY